MQFAFLGVAACFDWKWKRIPWSVQGMGVIFVIVTMIMQRDRSAAEWILAAMPGMVLLMLAWVTRENIGYGDGVSVLLLGGITGLRNCIAALCLSMLLLSLAGIVLLVLKRADRKTRIPYLPFLFAAEGILTAICAA